MDGELGRDPMELPLVTLDNNALIALRKEEPAAPAVREILEMNRAGVIVANVTLSTAFEAGPDGRMQDHQDQQEQVAWLQSLGIARAHIYTHSVSVAFDTLEFPGVPFFDPQREVALAWNIEHLLFPNMGFRWRDHLRAALEQLPLTDVEKQALLELDRRLLWEGRTPPMPTPTLDTLSEATHEKLAQRRQKLYRRWWNNKNDASGLTIHFTLAMQTRHPEQSVFVTSDTILWRPGTTQALRPLGFRGEILRPRDAVTFLRTVTSKPGSI